MEAIEMISVAVIAYLGYKAFSQGIPVAAVAQDVTAAPTMRRRVVRRSVVRRRVTA
jgi:threonine/homoserine/homoserine lactone efflux protein